MRIPAPWLSALALWTVTTSSCGFNRDDGWYTEEVVSLDDSPPPIHGGTLLVLRDGSHVIVGDPDRGRLVRVALASGERRELRLETGLELGRLVEDAAGRVHVVARRGGAVIEVDPTTMTELARRSVCEAPRGLAWQELGDRLHVACADGTLVTLDPSRAIERTLWVGGDLRDVAVVEDAVLVTRFRSAESVRVRADGTVESPRSMAVATLSSPASPELSQYYDPNTAVRLVSTGRSALVLHQRARVGAEAVVRAPASTYSYSSRPTSDGFVTWQDPCGNAVAHTTVSVMGSLGQFARAGLPISRGVTPVDLAVSSEGRVAVAFAGDPGGRWSAGPQVVSARVSELASAPESRTDCMPGTVGNRYPGQVISVAFAGQTLLVQTREPATLVVEPEGGERTVLALGGEPVRDTGHAVFHMDLGGTISCATCHPGGADDGHVWTFAATGSIRTQSLEGVVGLPPYHRAGDVPSFEALLRRLEVQMDAPSLEGPRTDALEHWLESVPLAPRGAPRDETLALEGAAIFQREGCASCHEGTLGSDRELHEVADAMQITAPLAGLAARAPYLRDGRAPDLERALMGHEIALPDAEREALVAYLESR
jgi:mono/diheme cytochrome c family protein